MALRHVTDAQWDRIRPPPLPEVIRSPKAAVSPRRCPAVLRRDSVDSLDRGAVERTAQAVWQPQYLLATTTAVGNELDTPCAVAGHTGPIE